MKKNINSLILRLFCLNCTENTLECGGQFLKLFNIFNVTGVGYVSGWIRNFYFLDPDLELF